VAACYTPPEPACGFICGPEDACPADYTCQSDHRCHRTPPEPACGFICGPEDACPADYTCQSDHRCHRNASPQMTCGPVDAALDTLLDADTTAPTVTTTPPDGATGVPTSNDVIAWFSEPVVGVDGTSFALVQEGVGVIASLVTEMDPTSYLLLPQSALPANARFTIVLQSSIADLAGNHLAPTSSQFMTGS
jgi:hypothetical protein